MRNHGVVRTVVRGKLIFLEERDAGLKVRRRTLFLRQHIGTGRGAQKKIIRSMRSALHRGRAHAAELWLSGILVIEH